MIQLIHGGDRYGCDADTIDFSSNISPFGLPEAVKTALSNDVASWDSYPDPLCRDLTAALATYENVPSEWILCGNGSADLIFRIALAVRGEHALVTAPAFAEYEQALRASGYQVMHHTLHEKDGFALTSSILGKITPALNLVILCSPNNPTGKMIEPELLEAIVVRCRQYGVTLLLDECFLPFVEDGASRSLKQKLGENPQLVLLHAFTKTYAMAGLRLGYMLCSNPEFVQKVYECGQPWGVSAPAQTAGIAALESVDYLGKVREMVAKERDYLAQALSGLGMTLYESQANFLFFKCHKRRDLVECMREKGFLIRGCANYYGLDDRFYRVAVRTHAENEKLVAALGEVLKLGAV